ncbi:hypothetical protein ACU8KO_002573 [Vibrio alginolyticus]
MAENDLVCDNPLGRCHQSVALLLINEPEDGDHLCTGYELNHYNHEWFQHSVVINGNNQIVEPDTALHRAYFVAELKGEVRDEFIQIWLES